MFKHAKCYPCNIPISQFEKKSPPSGKKHIKHRFLKSRTATMKLKRSLLPKQLLHQGDRTSIILANCQIQNWKKTK